MGFSLEGFFLDLSDLIGADMQDQDKLTAMIELVEQGKSYAEECGMINKEGK